MGRKEDNIKKAQALMTQHSMIRNIGIAAHIDHGKTTLSDNLIAGAGMMSEELAGKQLLLDFDEQEQARGITINAANASMVHAYGDKEFLINLIDTPGHVDFGGDVTRAMRAVDGSIVVVCAVEGIMPQTETVIRQSLKERVRPLLFINKVDRLINELQVTPEQMQERFIKIIKNVNDLIMKMVPPEFKKDWGLKVDDGSVAFGSAYHNWAISVPFMKESGISFKDIYDFCDKDEQRDLSKKAPIHQILLDMVIEHCPDPIIAQNRRIPNIWHGDIESEVGQSMMKCDGKGPVALMVTKIIMDPHAGEIAIGRMYSGSIKRGQTLHVLGMPNPNRVQQVSLCVGSDRIAVDEIDAGNIVAVNGLKDAIAGSTVADNPDMEAFEKIVHYSEPVVTVAIEAKHMRDLPKLVDVLRSVAKADPSIQVDINKETGEHLMSGMGELHLEITEYRIKNEYDVEIQSSPPIVVYRECIDKPAGPFEGKSPNKHNRFFITVSPLEEEIVKAIREGTIQVEGKIKDSKVLGAQLQEMGLTKEEAKKLVVFEGSNVLIDGSKGVQNLHETMELCKEAFKEAMVRGPLAEEKVMGVKVKLMDAKLHEDTIHRGPAQVIPAVRQAIYGAMCIAGRTLQEPKQMVYVSVPQDVMGGATSEMQQRRAVIEDMEQDGDLTVIKSKAPVAEMFGFSNDMRSVTGGRASWSTENCGFERIPRELQQDVVAKIRTRKGLKPEPYDEHYYSSA